MSLSSVRFLSLVPAPPLPAYQETLIALGFWPRCDSAASPKKWSLVQMDAEGNQRIAATISDEAAQMSLAEARGLPNLHKFWRLLGWRRIAGGWARHSYYMSDDDAKRQYKARKEAPPF